MSELFQYPAKVLKVGRRAREDLMQLAKDSGAYDEDIFEERQPFFWSAEISNDQVDAYSTWMMDSTLNNFAADCRAGVAFLTGHRHSDLPIGRSINARVEDDGQRKKVIADFYTIPGLTLNGMATDDFIAGVRAGIVSDVSVGFHGGEMWCDVCGGNYRDYNSCQHFAGQRVETQAGFITVTVGIDGARLSEVSAVYDGATPDATILKAQRMAEAGALDPKSRTSLEQRYRMKLPEQRIFAVAEPVSAVPKERIMDFEKLVNDVRAALGIGKDDDVLGAITNIAEQAQKLRSVEADRDALAGKLKSEQQRSAELDAKVKELEPQAADGRAYRTDLISEAVAEGVRAYGQSFDAETYQTVLNAAPLSTIKRMKADWQLVGDKTFVGGRQSQDSGAAPEPKQERKQLVSDDYYKA